MKPSIDYTLYLVTDSRLMSADCLETAVKEAVKGGCTLVQLREKDISSSDFYKLALKVKAVTDRYKIPLIVNDRADVALAADAAGVHVGQDDLPCSAVRKILGPDKIVGVSVSNTAEALKAKADGADYIGVGAMFATGTKTDAQTVSREELIRITRQASLPTVVIGGINPETIPYFEGIPIDGLAVVSAIIAQPDIRTAAANIKKQFTKGRRPIVRGIEAAIFDLDGTLLDSMDVWERVDTAFFKKRGLEAPPSFLNTVSAMSFREAAEYTIGLFKLDDTVSGLLAEWDAMAAREYAHNIRLKPHAREYLDELKQNGIRLAVATGLPRRLLEPVLKNNGIYGLFDVICSVNDVARGKEHPDVFKHTIERLGASPSSCMVFEDLAAAPASAKQAGARVCGVYDKAAKSFVEKLKSISDFYIKTFQPAPVLRRG